MGNDPCVIYNNLWTSQEMTVPSGRTPYGRIIALKYLRLMVVLFCLADEEKCRDSNVRQFFLSCLDKLVNILWSRIYKTRRYIFT